MTDSLKLTWQERDLMLSAVIAHAEEKAGKGYAHAYAFGMIQALLTDDQIRRLFRIAQD